MRTNTTKGHSTKLSAGNWDGAIVSAVTWNYTLTGLLALRKLHWKILTFDSTHFHIRLCSCSAAHNLICLSPGVVPLILTFRVSCTTEYCRFVLVKKLLWRHVFYFAVMFLKLLNYRCSLRCLLIQYSQSWTVNTPNPLWQYKGRKLQSLRFREHCSLQWTMTAFITECKNNISLNLWKEALTTQLRDTSFSWFIPAAMHLPPAVPVFTLKDKEKHTLRTPE